ncbi:unnamed protein product [Effrenium voratum]|nr:unnamed protein product [Effrenium voratum]
MAARLERLAAPGAMRGSTDSGVALRRGPMRDLAQQLAAQLRAWQVWNNPSASVWRWQSWWVGCQSLACPGPQFWLDDIAELLRLSSSSEWPWPSASFSPKTLEAHAVSTLLKKKEDPLLGPMFVDHFLDLIALVPALQWLLGLCETFPVRALEEINATSNPLQGSGGPISGVDCLALAPPRASWASRPPENATFFQRSIPTKFHPQRRMSGVSSALLVCVRATFVDVEELSVKPYKLQRSHSEPALCTQEDVGVESPEVMSMWKINTQQADPIDDQLDSRGNEGSLGHPEVCRRPCVHFAARGCSAGRACSYCHAEHPKRPPSLDKAWRSRLGKLTEGQLLAIVLGQLRARAERKNFLPAAEGLLGILERRWQQLGAELPRLMSEQQSMRRVLSKMTFAGLLSLATSKTNADPFLQEIKVALEQLRRALPEEV